MAISGQPTVNYAYLNNNLLSSITRGSNVVSFAYDNANRPDTITGHWAPAYRMRCMKYSCSLGGMANVQIRDVPDDVHRELRARAAAAGISLSEFLRGELKRVAARPPVSAVLERAETRHGGASRRQIVAALRDARTRPHAS